jgi:signal transduction histidine kinase
MGVAFAGLLGLAVADRLSDRAGLALAGLTLLLAPVAAGLPLVNGNMGPWAVVQVGGLVVLAALACRRVRPGALGFSIAAVIALYAVAKGLELSDHAVFALTHGAVSGHSLKHAVAALAAVPVLLALRRAHAQRAATSAGQNHTSVAGTRGDGGTRRGVAPRTV